MTFPAYPEYKDSGVEWLGKVPVHWSIKALKHVVSIPITDGPHETPEFIDEGVPFVSAEAVSSGKIDFSKIRGFISRVSHEKYSQKYVPKRGDIFMVKSGATTGVCAIVETDDEFNIWSPLAVVRCMDDIEPHFVLNYMRSLNFQEAIALNWNFGTQQNIGMGVIESLMVPLASHQEQITIANFLVHETEKINALIAEQEKLIELLNEKRQSIISNAVCRGLDPNVPMKDSGVEWLGMVPEHWKIAGLTKLIGSVVDYRGRTPLKVDEGVFLVTARNIRNGRIDYEISKEYVDANSVSSLMARGMPEIGDVLFTMEAPLGQVALVDRTDIGLAQRIVKFRGLSNLMQGDFLVFWLMSSFTQARLETLATGSTALGIKASKLGMIECLAPPVSEQKLIVSFIESELKKIDELHVEAKALIKLLEERRSALISAAVCGLIDVRNFHGN
jgi:type I restriction enzyme S subunit